MSRSRSGAVRERAAQLPAAAAAKFSGLIDHALDSVRGTEAQLRESALWWTAPDMTALAVQAAATLPEWTLSQVIPEPWGIMVWGGDTGIRMPWPDAPPECCTSDFTGSPRPPLAQIRGVIWGSGPSGLDLNPLTDDPRVVHARYPQARAGLVDLVYLEAPDDVFRETLRSREILGPLVGATWLLAQQPGVGHTTHREMESPRDHRAGPGPGPRPVSPVTIVTLRERAKPASPEPGADTSRAERVYSHRWLVSGHWRQQAVGPGRAYRRPTWVLPHIKGPDGAPIKEKETVHVWRR